MPKLTFGPQISFKRHLRNTVKIVKNWGPKWFPQTAPLSLILGQSVFDFGNVFNINFLQTKGHDFGLTHISIIRTTGLMMSEMTLTQWSILAFTLVMVTGLGSLMDKDLSKNFSFKKKKKSRTFPFNTSLWITFEGLCAVQMYLEFSDINVSRHAHLSLCTHFVLVGIHENLEKLMTSRENLTQLE